MPITNQHPLKKYFDMCLWLGLPVATMSIEDCFMAGGQIIKATLQKRVATGKGVQELIESMTPAELDSLRGSVTYQESVGIRAGR
jgi:hypothetical protein